MQNSIIKKLIFLVLIFINTNSPNEKLNRCTISLKTVYVQAPENKLRSIKKHPEKIEYFSVGARFDNPIIVPLTLKPIEKIEVIIVV